MMEWQPIEIAPKDQRILLYRPTTVSNWAKIVIGQYEDDEYAVRPKPFWSHDLESLTGKKEARANHPTHWMPLPEPPAGD